MKRTIWLAALGLLVVGVALSNGSATASPTAFGGVFVAGNGDNAGETTRFNNSVDNLAAALDAANWDPGNQQKIKQGNEAAIDAAISQFKPNGAKELQSGDEFLFYFTGHGGDNNRFPSAGEAGEGNGTDNYVRVTNALRITDDLLKTKLSGFNESVTINVILDSCKSNTFTDGADDLPSITQKRNDGSDAGVGGHLAVVAAGDLAFGEAMTNRIVDGLQVGPGGFRKADANQDGVITTKEASDYAGGTFSGGADTEAKCDSDVECPCGPIDQPTHIDEGQPTNKIAEPGMPPGLPVGGIAGLRDDSVTPAKAAVDSGGAPLAPIAAAVAAGVAALAAGGWYARRRWVLR